jgi:hypothetical protein
MINIKSVAGKLQALYDSEINFRIECFWDGGFNWQLGDELNGWKEFGGGDTIEEAAEDLWAAAEKIYPKATCFQE